MSFHKSGGYPPPHHHQQPQQPTNFFYSQNQHHGYERPLHLRVVIMAAKIFGALVGLIFIIQLPANGLGWWNDSDECDILTFYSLNSETCPNRLGGISLLLLSTIPWWIYSLKTSNAEIATWGDGLIGFGLENVALALNGWAALGVGVIGAIGELTVKKMARRNEPKEFDVSSPTFMGKVYTLTVILAGWTVGVAAYGGSDIGNAFWYGIAGILVEGLEALLMSRVPIRFTTVVRILFSWGQVGFVGYLRGSFVWGYVLGALDMSFVVAVDHFLFKPPSKVFANSTLPSTSHQHAGPASNVVVPAVA